MNLGRHWVRYEPYSWSAFVVSAYLVSVWFGEVGSGKGEAEAGRKMSDAVIYCEETRTSTLRRGVNRTDCGTCPCSAQTLGQCS